MSRYGDSARNVFEIYYETGLTLPLYLFSYHLVSYNFSRH